LKIGWKITMLIIPLATALIGLGVGLAVDPPASLRPPATHADSYSYYQAMIARYPGRSMMGGSSAGWMPGRTGYRWMMGGGATAPGWMRGDSLRGFMMGSDPGQTMGSLWANAPGPTVSASGSTRLANAVPAGASVDRRQRTLTFDGTTVVLAAVAGAPAGPDHTFRIAGMVNPTIIVPKDAHVTVEVINADPGSAHGFVVTAGSPGPAWMPMASHRPAFPRSALWFLGSPTASGMHEGKLSLLTRRSGSFQYLCPVPGHAETGMAGRFLVTAT
jgi:rusticyanin